jgi:hypothetical protein
MEFEFYITQLIVPRNGILAVRQCGLFGIPAVARKHRRQLEIF